jgi:hypothetical protein
MTDDVGRIQPLKGHIVPVRTVQETNPEIEFGKYILSFFS